MMERLLQTLFKELNRNVLYVVLRNFESLPFNIGNDLDLLINPGDLNKAIDALNLSCEENGFRIIKTTRRYSYRGFYLVENGGSEIILIDLFTGLFKAWREYAAVDSILESRIYRNGFYSVRLEDELSTIVSKELLTYGKVRQKYEERFKYIFDQEDFSLSACHYDFFTLKSRMDLSSVGSMQEFFVEREVQLRKGSLIKFLKYSFYRIEELLLRLTKKPFTVVFVGPDGVGKSTMSEELRGLLAGNNFFSGVEVYHHRFDFMPQLNSFKIKQHDTSKLAKSIAAADDDVVVHSRPRTLMYMAYYGLDYLFGYLDLINRQIRGGATIFDRYLYDFHIQKSYKLVPSGWKNVYAKFFPSPSLIVFLYANPHIVVNRKRELSFNDHIEQNKVCIDLLRANRDKAIFCNCNESLENSVIRMKKLILARF